MYRAIRLSGAALVLIGLVASSVIAADHSYSFVRGDCNSDTAVDISDAVKVLEDLFGSGVPPLCEDACDCNDDGAENIADAIYLLAALFSGGPAPSGPYPECGTDPTPDALGCEMQGPGSSCLVLPPDELRWMEPPRPTRAFPGRAIPADRPGEGIHVPIRSVNLFSGEVVHREVDLRIPSRGFDFVWERTHRSRMHGSSSEFGHGWVHSYDVSIQEVEGGLLLRDGSGRADLLTANALGEYTADGLFATGAFAGDGAFVLVFGNLGTWTFIPAGGLFAGRIGEIADRHGNAMQFSYAAAGLSQITDTLGRTLTIGHDAEGRISSLTDFAGRTVSYEYYAAGEPGGSPGDLKSATSPMVVGTPNGNDYPDGKTTLYAYSSGLADEELNHNLLSITDPKGQTFLQNVYSGETDADAAGFDRVVRQVWGHSGDIVDVDYQLYGGIIPCVRVIVNDRRGAVSEFDFDSRNTLQWERRYTGFALADQPTTETDNLPGPPLRPSDPPFFETTYEWNDDFLCTQVVHPNGSMTHRVFESDLTASPATRERGNLREVHHLPGTHTPVGDQAEIVELFLYEPGYGGWEAEKFLCSEVTPDGGETQHSYDAAGNRIQTTHRIPSIVEDWEYNAFGQLTAHIHPNSAALPAIQRRRDAFQYYASGPQMGFLQQETVDATGAMLTHGYSYDEVGNLVQVIDPNGNVTDLTVNALNQVVQVLSPTLPLPPPAGTTRYRSDLFYDANDNLARTDVRRFDEDGAPHPTDTALTEIVEFDILNQPIAVHREVGMFDVPPDVLVGTGLPGAEFVTTLHMYDENRQRIGTHLGEAANGNQPENKLGWIYDERGLLYRSIRGDGALTSTTQFDYDGNGNLVQVQEGLEDSPRTSTRVFDAFDREVLRTDPMGNQVISGWSPNSQLVSRRAEGELEDGPGSTDNVRVWEADFVHDAMDRLIVSQIHHFDPVTQASIGDGLAETSTAWSDSSLVLTRTDDNGNTTSFSYDTADRLSVRTDAMGNTRTHGYDANSNQTSLVELELATVAGVPSETLTTTWTHDALNRVTGVTDNIGNSIQYGYDSRGNLVLTTDAMGNVQRNEFDGLNRPVMTTRTLTDTGDGSGTPIGEVMTQQVWDDSSRLLAQLDDNGNATARAWDPLNRPIITMFADGTVETRGWDAHDNLVARTDPNGTSVAYSYDLLNRPTSEQATPGVGVSSDTILVGYLNGYFVRFTAGDEDATSRREYSSRFDLIRETWLEINAVVSSTFDGVGNRLTCTYPGGRTLEYSYDALNRVSQVTEAGDLIASYEYIGPRRVLSRSHGNDTQSMFDYDGARRVTGTTHVSEPFGANVPIDVRSYSWNPQSHKTERADLLPSGPGLIHTYGYDSLYRLTQTLVSTSAGVTDRDTQYLFDGVHNRIQVTDGECSGVYSMNDTVPAPGDFQMNQYSATGCDLRTHDDNGNLIGLGDAAAPQSRVYDFRNRMVQHTDAATGNIISYTYDPFGRRTGQTIQDPSGGAMASQYLWDGMREVEERDGAGATLRTYVYGIGIGEHGIGIGELIGFRSGSPLGGTEDHYYHADDLGNVMAVTDGDGDVVERYEYGDYGTPAFFDATGGPVAGTTIGNPFLFQGQRYCEATGIYYFRTRYLDPKVGRFTSRDTIGIWGDPSGLGNGATFVGNDPWSQTDPLGLFNPQPEPPAMPIETHIMWDDTVDPSDPHSYVLNSVRHSAQEPGPYERGQSGGSGYSNRNPSLWWMLARGGDAGLGGRSGGGIFSMGLQGRSDPWAPDPTGLRSDDPAMMPLRSSSRRKGLVLVPDDSFGLSRVRGGAGVGATGVKAPSELVDWKKATADLGVGGLKAPSVLRKLMPYDGISVKVPASLLKDAASNTLYKKAGILFMKENPFDMKEMPFGMKENPFGMEE